MNKVSVIIPCRNEEKYISGCLDSFVKSKFPKEDLEILIVDGKSDDNTINIVNEYSKKYPFIRLITNKLQVTPVALNLGIQNANNDYILIASAHSEFPCDYLSVLIYQIEKLGSDGVGGRLNTDVKNKTKKTQSIIKVLSNKFGVGNSMFRIGAKKPILVDTVPFGLYKKEIFYEIGFYREDLIRNHDIEWSKRLLAAGGKIFLIPEASCTYFARETYKELAKNNFRNGFWNILTVYITNKASSLSLRHFIPLIFILSVILPALLSFIYLPFIAFSIISVLSYLILVLIISIKLNDKTTDIYYLFKAFITLHLSYGLGSLAGLFKIDKLFILKK